MLCRRRISMYTLLIVAVVMTVGLLVAVFTMIAYFSMKSTRQAELVRHANLEADITARVVSPMLASYHVATYERLLESRMKDEAYLGIVIEDAQTGKVLGQTVFVNGKIRNRDLELVDYDPTDPIHQQMLDDAYQVVSREIVFNQQKMGVLHVYLSDRILNQELNAVLVYSVVSEIVLAVIIAVVLLISLGGIVVSPLQRINAIISDTDADGIPRRDLPECGTKEISALAVTMNRMIRLVRESRQQLKAHQDTLEATVEQRTRELVIAKEKADIANRAKDDFLANISHEIRTPLTAILGFIGILRSAELSERQQEEYFGIVERNGEHLLQLINDILDLSRIEAGRLQVNIEPCDLSDVLYDTCSLLKSRAVDKGIDMSVTIDGLVPQVIETDAVRLRQIVMNLVGNAIKFTEVGQVRMQLRYAIEADQPYLYIEIADTGIGMSEDQLRRIFSRFEQANSSTSRRFGGTGLGLTITEHLACLLGGDIQVTSTPDVGSTFTVRIRAATHENVKFVNSEQWGQGLRAQSSLDVQRATLQGRVLLAEDGPDNQRLIAFMLNRRGLEVEIASNGQQAVAMALASRDQDRMFELILMDIQMPEMDGYQATRQLRNAGWSGPIYALSAHAMKSEQAKAADAGMDGTITKPLMRGELDDVLDRFFLNG